MEYVEWVSLVRDEGQTLAGKCLALSRLVGQTNLDAGPYLATLDRMGRSLSDRVSKDKSDAYLISALGEYMFDVLGFGGNEIDYHAPANSLLDQVIDTKRGIPISLSVIYVDLARYIGLDLAIVGFPGHVLVRHGAEYVIDPYNRGSIMDADDLQDLLDASFDDQLTLVPEFLNEISHGQVLARMARNLKNAYLQSFAYDKAMVCSRLVLALEPDSAEDVRDMGILEAHLGRHDTALERLAEYLEMSPSAPDADYVLKMIHDQRGLVDNR